MKTSQPTLFPSHNGVVPPDYRPSNVIFHTFSPEDSIYFSRLNYRVRSTIIDCIDYIVRGVRKENPGAVQTSAFRSPSHCVKLNGNLSSKHIYGGAVDFRLGTISRPFSEGLTFVKKNTHWHVELEPEL